MTSCRLALLTLAVAIAAPAVADDSYATRRARLMAELPDGLILVRGAGVDGEVNPNFYYLTGIREPKGALLLAPEQARVETYRKYPGRNYIRGRMVRQILFLPQPDALAARWGEDSARTLDAADREALGIDALFASSDLDEILGRALQDVGTLHMVRAAAPELGAEPDEDARFAERVGRQFFGIALRDATARVHELRRIKDADEVGKIQRAVDVAGEGHARLMRTVRPGLREYQLEAELEHAWRMHGGRAAFEPIVASGPNATRMHYRTGERALAAGELVLIDAGAELDGYRSDVTRTIPVDGRFTPRQRELYEIVLRAQDAAIALCRPGAKMEDIHSKAFDVIAEAGYGKYFVHGTSHYLGLATHDPSDAYRPLEPGVVLTVEPGIYIPEEGVGIRIEDVVLVTDGAPRNLSAATPRTIAAIELAMGDRSQ